jgi:hypothetical protein
MRTAILMLVVLVLAAVPSNANIAFSDVSMGLFGPGFSESVEGDTSIDDPGSSNGSWTFTADLTTNLTPVGGGNFTSPDIFMATLDDLTLSCVNLSGCGSTTISFYVDVVPLNGGSHKLPWEVNLAGTVKGLNATFSDNLTADPYKVVGTSMTRSFNASASGTSIFNGDVIFNGTITVPGGVDGAVLTLPFGADFGVPEPATLGLMGTALAGLAWMRWRRRSKR